MTKQTNTKVVPDPEKASEFVAQVAKWAQENNRKAGICTGKVVELDGQKVTMIVVGPAGS
jgi:predicted ATP-grasp superfamily ATP-dependent carboligase